MSKNRLEAFSDGVIAIIITIMVLALPVPHTADRGAWMPLSSALISYALSYFFVTIYWLNHHHLFQLVKNVRSSLLIKNALFLFFLSFIPWATNTMGQNHFEKASVIMYTLICVLTAACFSLVVRDVVDLRRGDVSMGELMHTLKPREYLTQALNVLALIASFFWPGVALVFIFLLTALWIVPNKDFEAFAASLSS